MENKNYDLSKLTEPEIIEKIGNIKKEMEDTFDEVIELTKKGLINAIESIKKGVDQANFQDKKRLVGYLLFDEMVDSCFKGICPSILTNKSVIYPLTDVSINGYLLKKAFLIYKKTGCGDSVKNYHIAHERISKIFNCGGKINGTDIFIEDTNQINDIGASHFSSSRKRKAYWRYQTYPENYDSFFNYISAESFIKRLHGISLKEECTTEDVSNAKEILKKNYHIANPLDLFRLCVIKSKATRE